MKPMRTLVILMLSFCVALMMAACGTSSSGNLGTLQPTAAQPATAQPTPKPKPTGAPTLTVKLCTQLMSVDEANTIIQPKTPATTIVPTNGDTGGACNYEASKTIIPLIIYFLDWNGPNPIPQSDINAALSQAAGTDITINKAVPVTGIGDQAEYIEATGTNHGFTANAHVFYVLYGKMFFDCITYSPVSGGTMATQAQLQQCATQVVNRL